jgi:WhiB family redox-sensing transcriptional regulator
MSTVHLSPIHTTVDAEFAGIVQPIATAVARPRCADGHGTLTHLFFSEVPLDIARAKAICGKCSLADTCRQAAVDRVEPWGVWGGVLIENGKVIADKRPRGRPPKHARPVVTIDEVPVPPHLLPTEQVA